MDKDNQDHKKLQLTPGGHGSHGVRLCHQCGWPFPNPHPSAKHRRAHKKVCGTIEGYKLADSGSVDPTVTVSDDDNLSDDDRRTPSPKHTEKSNDGKNSVVLAERSSRSEGEVFGDAVTEFTDSGFTPGIEERPKDARITATDVEKSGEKGFLVFYSFKDNAFADIAEWSNNSSDSGQMQNLEVPENAIALPEINQESQINVLRSTEETAVILTDANSEKKFCDFQPVEPETPIRVAQEIKVMNAGDAARDGLTTYTGQETDAKGNDEINSECNIVPSSVSDNPGQTSKVESKCLEKEEITFDSTSAAEVVLSKEDNGTELVSKMSLGDPIHLLESVELSDATATAQNNKVGASTVNSTEGFSGNGEGNKNGHELSVLADIHVVDNADSMLEEFKDHKGGVKLRQPLTLDSAEIVQDKKDDFENPFTMEDHDSLQTIQLSEVSKVSASDMLVVEDNLVDHCRMHVVGNPSTKGERDESQIKLPSNDGSDELGAPSQAVTIGMEQGNPVSSIENQQHSDVSDDSLHVCAEETTVSVSHDVNPVIASPYTKVIGLHDAGNHENLASDMCDVGKDEKEIVTEEDYAKIMITTSESDTNLCEFQINPAINLCENGDAGYLEKGKIKKCVVVEVESKEETLEEKVLLETHTVFESNSNLHEYQAIDDDKMDLSLMKLPETKLTNIEGVSDMPDISMQLQVKGNGEELGEFNNAEHGRNINSLEKTSEEHAAKVPLLLPLDTESSILASVVDNSDTIECGTGRYGIDQASQGEINNNKHHFGASGIDVSVDSSSQTDSLEANWGSVSVLSTQSDILALLDGETLASAEAEKLNLKKLECATERQHSEESGIFEAPSFMTLVEPGCGSYQKAVASDINIVQNLDQKQAHSQAGWFPSLTHVVNGSQGRKKNEEIIAKVTNWSTGKQYTSLKNLLTKANLETNPKSANPRENKISVIQKDNTATKESKALVTTVSSMLAPEAPDTESTTRETGKKLNSLERYPVDIEREKRKVKGRPYWAQFVCCSSAH